MRKFKELQIWQSGIEITKAVYKVAEQLPNEERFGIRSQMTRAAVSIPSNIAEGSSRQSDTDFRRFLEIALGSLYELETQLIVLKELSIIDSKELEPLFEIIEQESKMINRFMSKVKTFSNSPKPKTKVRD
ncbi:30S ribosomal protein S23 [Porphyromonadaceae bacterium COT-184 OH4590]|nr:30S ribosomal protein S23 [Porphyromonadaceae bacterium COT-184 OH4590]